MITKAAPNRHALKKALFYDKDNGIFIWKTGKNAGKIAGTRTTNGYVVIAFNNIRYQAHRLAWYYVTGEWPLVIDHKNRIRHHNWFDNLQNGTQSDNLQNIWNRSDNTSGLNGISQQAKTEKWIAQKNINKEHYYLGCYDTKEEAKEAYDKFLVKAD